VTSLLTEEGGGIEIRDAETSPAGDDDEKSTEVLVWIASSSVETKVHRVEKLLRSLKEMGTQVDPWSWRSDEVDPSEWHEAYKRFFKVNRIGRYFVIKPSWEEYEAKPHELMIALDPGMAFGTGLHASTRMVIHAMERLAHNQPAPKAVLDLGCGTGILSIAAAKLWPATRVLAIDNDETAVDVCRENVNRNGLESRIMVEHRSAKEVKGSYSLVLANLTAEILTEIQPSMRRLLDAFGHMILSGITADQVRTVTRGYCADLVFETEYSEEAEGWRTVLLEVRE
jgi:ribosomal protein L11 methyltransferase